MKRIFAMLPLLALVLAAFAVSVARADSGIDAYLRDRYDGWETVTVTRNGDAGAAILQKKEQSVLVVIKGEKVIDRVLDNGSRRGVSVLLDTEDMLFLTLGDARDQSVYDFHYVQDRWLLGGVTSFQTTPYEDTAAPDNTRYLTAEDRCDLLDDAVCPIQLLDDENDNILWSRTLPSLPDVLTEEEKDLAHWDPSSSLLSGAGYRSSWYDSPSEDVCRRLFDALKESTPYAAYTYADGLIKADTLQFVADRPDGSRVLLCGSPEGEQGWQFTESTPLPAGTTIGIENFVEHLALGQVNGRPFGASVQRFADGTWGLHFVGDNMSMGQNWICTEGYPYFGQEMMIGDHPWNDITKIDWSTVSQTPEAALAGLDTHRWATPNSSNVLDRLNLRERPDRTSGSLGKFYNGTPVEVLERGKEWTRVRVGPQEGYMMTQYLAFGDDIHSVNGANVGKFFARPVVNVYWQLDQYARSEAVPTQARDTPSFVFVGLADGDWWLVWDMEANRFGRIRAEDLWEGNG